MALLLILFYLTFPLLISFFTQKYAILNKIGPVLLCYATGLALGHSGLLNDSVSEIQENTTNASILLALPILLFDSNPSKWRASAGSTFKSMLIAIVVLIVVVALGHIIFSSGLPERWKLGGMMIGIYTGGTPNLASIKTALGVPNAVYIGIHTIDTFLGAIYLLFLMTIGKTWFRKLLPAYKQTDRVHTEFAQQSLNFKSWLSAFNYKYAALGLLVSIVIAAISAGTGFLFKEEYQMTIIILLITTLGISASLLPFSGKLKTAFPVGMYLINVFSLAVASQANLFEITYLGSTLIYYVSFVLFATFALHLFVSKLFKIDADTMMITSTALICSPPFVPVVAGSLNNKGLLLPGITVGIIGYAIGNYLGILIAFILK